MSDNGAPSRDEDMTAPTTLDAKDNNGKGDTAGEHSSESLASSPEHDAEPFPQENPQAQKRKGGRKPIYATSEERKQRNRQAQAAFRERRTEYIKQLETTIKSHEENLRTLQASHRSAMDECLLLRYKNSLLERILLEKGIDVQAELQAKTGSPNFGPHHAPPPQSGGPVPPGTSRSPMQRAIMNRHHQARSSVTNMTPKLDGRPMSGDGMMPNPSPRLQPTPASHASSPAIASTRSPNFLPQNGMTSPTVTSLAGQQQMRQQQQSRPQYMQPTPPQRPQISTNNITPNGPLSAGMSSAGSGVSGTVSAGASSYYPSPFRSHMDQLEQEYDAQADMYDDQDPSDQSAGPGPFPYGGQQQISPHGLPTPVNTQHPQGQQQFQPGGTQDNQPVFPPANSSFDAFDPMLDADPFGLSASMHFPTQFSYESR